MKTTSKHALNKLWQHGFVTSETTLYLYVKHENDTYKYVSFVTKWFPFNQYLKN